jgi:ATP-binding cassette, subfamily A (ABC1), member 3
VYPALFTLYPTYERLHKVRALQYSNGVRDLPLWISYAMFDFIFVLVVSTICTAIVAVQAPTFFGVGYLCLVLLLYGLSATLFSYVVSMISRSQLAAFALAAGAQGIMVLLTLLAFTVSRGLNET